MHKTTKAALAAAASATLLVGGAGSLAYWNTTDDVTAGTFTTGELVLDFSNCDAAGWTVSNAVEDVEDVAFNLATERVVPGDVFTKTCEIGVTAVGTNLRAAFGVTGGGKTFDAGLVEDDDVTVTSTFLVGANEENAESVTEITDANEGHSVFVTLTVDFPIGGTVDNGSQDESLVLQNYVVTATQVTEPSATPTA